MRGGAPGGPLGVMPADRPILNDQERNGTMLKVLHGLTSIWTAPFRPKPGCGRPAAGRAAGAAGPADRSGPGAGGRPGAPLRGPAGRGPGVPGDRPGPGPGPGRDSLPRIPGPGQPRLVRSPVPLCRAGVAGERPPVHRPGAGGGAAAELGCTVWGAAFCAPRQSASPCGAFMPRGGGPAGRPPRGGGRPGGLRPHLGGGHRRQRAGLPGPGPCPPVQRPAPGRGDFLGLPRLPRGAWL